MYHSYSGGFFVGVHLKEGPNLNTVNVCGDGYSNNSNTDPRETLGLPQPVPAFVMHSFSDGISLKDVNLRNRKVNMLSKWKIKWATKQAQADLSKALAAEEERLIDPRKLKKGLAADLEATRYIS